MIPDISPLPDFGPVDTGGVLHDLGHGLFTLSCLTESVLKTESLPSGMRIRLTLISEEAARLLDLVRQASAAGDAPKPVNVRTLLEAAAQVAAQATGAAVTVRPGAAVWVVTDELALWRMITNLVDNGVRAAGPVGEVELTAEPGPPVVITVADNGPGFGQGARGWAGRGLRVVSEQAGAGGARVRIERR
ncbi:sensor histidine kinase, partial [Amycolatopsis sp. SID8362]|uniref:sensor histidine kinase n=1 Tax=Amycolatopsis sp. SID8362 TaxID=2690346 RepID=UPI00136D6205